MSLSFLDHYCSRPSSWTLSGSCPLCLTPPCYQPRAAGNGGSFLCHFGAAVAKPRIFSALKLARQLCRQLRLDRKARGPPCLPNRYGAGQTSRLVRRSVMSEKSQFSDAQPVSFGERLANSQAFADLFRDGMALVEETATYLDGPGRAESKKLARAAALGLRHREHAAHHAADAARLLAAAASRGQGRRDVARPGQQGKDQGQAVGQPIITIPTTSSCCRRRCAS